MPNYSSSYTGTQHDEYVTKQALIDLVYPVGSFYMSSSSTSPATLFGGTWEQIKDTFILAAGDTYTAGNSGGEESHTLISDEMPSHSHSFIGNVVNTDSAGGHTHTAQEGGAHTHVIYLNDDSGFKVGLVLNWGGSNTGANIQVIGGGQTTNGTTFQAIARSPGNHTHSTDSKGAHTHSITPTGTISSTGSGSAHNNMPPYLVAYIWKRTA